MNYNERFDFFTLDLMKDDQVLLQGVKTRIRRSCFCRHRGPPLSVPLIVRLTRQAGKRP
ncbi:hypothetical protein [Paenibacillus melissococcoides]|uniref:hypothetical protein n=1 Tax=Paenibacillus melissococcoides TaxID=2912268 RepID=UPI0036F383CA